MTQQLQDAHVRFRTHVDRLSLQYTKAAFTTAIATLVDRVQNELIYIKYHLDSVL